MNRTRAGAMKMLDAVLNQVLNGEPEGYSVIFTEYHNPDKEPNKHRGPIDDAFKDVLNGTYSAVNIGKDVIFETPSDVMSILRDYIGKELPRIKIMEYVLPKVPVGYIYPVIVIKK